MPTVADLAARLGGDIPGESGTVEITGLSGLAEAEPGDISFFGHPRYAPDLKATRASAVLVARDFAGETSAACIRVDDPSASFAEIAAIFTPSTVRPLPGIHPSAVVAADARVAADASVAALAVIESGAVVGPRSIIGSGCHIGSGAAVGEDCHLHPHVTVRERCVVGNRVILHSGVVIGSDGFGYDTKDGRHRKIPQTGIVALGDDVEIGANTTIDRARFGRTVIGEGTKIDNLVMIAHNVVIGRHCIVCAQVGIAGSTQIGDHVILAGQAGLVGHIKIGDRAIIGAQTGVSNDVESGARVVGSPPRPIGDWKRAVVRIDRLGQLYDRVKKLEERAG